MTETKGPEKKGAEKASLAGIKFPIAAKLVVIITVIVLVALGSLTLLVTWLVREDVRITAEQNNHTINARSAAAAESELMTIRANVFLLLDLLNAAGSSGTLARQASAFFFERNQHVAAIVLTDAGGVARGLHLVSTRFFLSNELDPSIPAAFVAASDALIKRAEAGESMLLNAAASFGTPIIVAMFPWKELGYPQAALVFFSADALSEAFGTGTVNSSYMVNQQGDLLVHPDPELVKAGVNLSEHPLVSAMWKNNDSNRQIRFRTKDPGSSTTRDYFGSYHALSIANCAVMTTVEASMVFEGVAQTTARSLYLTLAVLSMAVLFVWFFSKSISVPVRRLARASEEVASGNFEVRIDSRSKDEIGFLAHRFTDMAKGLAERERLKDAFGRFINKEIAERALKGEITLGGETKTATIFFSDIRSFTAMSESLEPYQVVEFLNEYMTRMVDCVKKTNGVVDKFIGDAVMAVWGAPVSVGSPSEDAFNCIKASLLMRESLIEFNRGRGGDKTPLIRIGCGINTGPVIAGQIGSHERMEYTVIGDTVNLASRAESLNKPFSTDILITENTWQLVKDRIVAEKMPIVKVKGKDKPVQLYAVIGLAGKSPSLCLSDVRRTLGLSEPERANMDVDVDEKKYKIDDL